jgi:hypothetical protein
MAVDTTLIRGAGLAAKDRNIGIKAKALNKIGDTIREGVTTLMWTEKVKAERANEEFTRNIMNAELDPASSNSMIDATMEQRQAYVDSKDPIEKQKILNNINSMSQDFGEMEGVMEAMQSGDIKMSNTFSNTAEGRNFSKAIGDPANIQVLDGKVGVVINGEFMDKDDLTKYINSKAMDTSFTKVMNTLAFDQQEDKKDLGDAYEFDRDYVRSKVKADIEKSANYRSLYEDNLYGNRNFKTDLIESLGNYTYSNLGITEQHLANSNVNVTDGVDAEEIKNLLAYIESNEYVMRELLGEYYTDLLEQQFDPYRNRQSAASEVLRYEINKPRQEEVNIG